jgi:CHAT domain-containing protein
VIVPQSDHFLSLLFRITSRRKTLLRKLVIPHLRLRLLLLNANRASAFLIAILVLTLTPKHTTANMECRLVDRAFIQEDSSRQQGTAESLKSAIKKYEDTLLLRRAAEDHAGEAVLLNKIGDAYDHLGEKQQALHCFLKALPLLHALGDGKGEARAAVRISDIYSDIGDMKKALVYLDIALQVNRATYDRVGEAAVLTALGNRYNRLGERERALGYYNKALGLWRAVADRSNEASTLDRMGKAYMFEDQPQKALLHFEQALTLHRTLGDRRNEAYALHNMSWAYHTLGDRPKALDYNTQALSLMQSVGDRRGEAAIFTNMGWVHELSGNPQKALDYYNRALAVMQATADWHGEANTLYRLANVERDQSRLSKARTHIEAALSVIQSVRSTVTSTESRASYSATVQRYHQFYIDLLFRLHERNPSEGYDAEALRANEHARARGLLDLLAEAQVDIRKGVDPALLNRERELQRLITAKTDSRIRLLNGKHTEQQARDAAQELADLVSAYREIETMIRASSPHYAALTQPQPLTLIEIQKLLDADTILLEYALGESRSFLWLVTPNSIRSYKLDKRSVIEAAVERVYTLLTARTRKIPNESNRQKKARIAKADLEYGHAARNLSRMLLGPVTPELRKKRLLIVSDEALQYIPFAALPELSGASQEVGDKDSTGINHKRTTSSYHPLILKHEIVNVPSVSTLALLRRDLVGRKPPSKTVAVFADPVFEATDLRVNQKSRFPSSASKQQHRNDERKSQAIRDYLRRLGLIQEEQPLARLSYSRKEALAIASLVPETQRKLVLDFEVNYDAVTNTQLSEYRFVHFATHGVLDPQEPELSGILLSLVDKEGRPQENGLLRLGDVYNLDLPVELVSLSACETALGKRVKGEGLVGLTRGFMYAGAPRVLATLWKVDEVATADTMKLFYEGMLGSQKLRPAAALREAQKQMWQRDPNGSPFYWAAFVLQGEWR